MSDRNRLSVLHVVLGFDKGGLEVVVLNLFRHLAAAGHRSAVLALDGGGEIAELARGEGCEVVTLGGRRFWSPGFHRRAYQVLSRLRPRVLHSHHPSALLHTLPASWVVGGMRRVHTEHSSRYFGREPRMKAIMRVASRTVDSFVTVAHSAERLYAEDIGVPAERLKVVPNGIDVSRFFPASPAERVALRRDLGLVGDPLIGAAGRLHRIKNLGLLLRSAAAALPANPDLGVVLIGDGEIKDQLRDEAAALGLGGRVQFVGWRNDAERYLRALDVFALSSTTEALPLALLEGMASGLAVVATAVGDVPRIVADAGCGGTVAVADEAGYQALLGQYLRDPDLRRRAGLAARTHVQTSYSIEAMVASYLREYGLD